MAALPAVAPLVPVAASRWEAPARQPPLLRRAVAPLPPLPPPLLLAVVVVAAAHAGAAGPVLLARVALELVLHLPPVPGAPVALLLARARPEPPAAQGHTLGRRVQLMPTRAQPSDGAAALDRQPATSKRERHCSGGCKHALAMGLFATDCRSVNAFG